MSIMNPTRRLQLLYDELNAVINVINEVPEYAEALLERKTQIEQKIEELENEIYR